MFVPSGEPPRFNEKSLLRREEAPAEVGFMVIYRFGPFQLDKEQLLLSCDGAPLPLGPKVVETLLALVEHPGDLFSKAELIARVWPEGYVEEANLAQNIYVIRKALRAHWPAEAIVTVPRRGYRFAAPVSAVVTEQHHCAEPVTARLPSRSWRSAAVAVATICAVLAIAAGMVDAARTQTPRAVQSRGLSPAGARLYAMGEFYWSERTASSVAMSLRYFNRVIASDPRDARGYAGAAAAYAIDADYGFGKIPRPRAFAIARQYALHALALHAASAEAQAVLGLTDDRNGRTTAAAREYRRAIAANPRYAPAHQWYGALLLRKGDGAGALRELQKAAYLDPVSVAATDWLATAAYYARRYSDAIAYARQALDLSPQRFDAYIPMGMAYEALGNDREAIAAYRRYGSSCSTCRNEAAALLAHAYAASHRYADAQIQLRIAQRGIASRSVDPEDLITALVAMGRREEALHILRDAKHEDDAVLAIDPRMDPVRHDARFRSYTQSPTS
jgi:DNA-binding winged helix-turn-helix (wHTH) protein/Flp pilus assembly protein TadD